MCSPGVRPMQLCSCISVRHASPNDQPDRKYQTSIPMVYPIPFKTPTTSSVLLRLPPSKMTPIPTRRSAPRSPLECPLATYIKPSFPPFTSALPNLLDAAPAGAAVNSATNHASGGARVEILSIPACLFSRKSSTPDLPRELTPASRPPPPKPVHMMAYVRIRHYLVFQCGSV